MAGVPEVTPDRPHTDPSPARPGLPEGIVVQAAGAVPMSEGSLQQEVGSCDWELEVSGVSSEELRQRAETVLASTVLIVSRERKGRAVDDDIGGRWQRQQRRVVTLRADGDDLAVRAVHALAGDLLVPG